MSTVFGVEPTTEHHVCLVDLLGRAGRLAEAYKFIEGIQPQEELNVWGALLSACKYHGHVKMGEQVAEHVFKIDPEDAGYYVSLFNIYAADGRWSDAMNVRRMFDNRMLRKNPGYSLIDVCTWRKPDQ
ncbi:Pentatricopeptide repeat-containing protein [Thalictrum thalictroides]|uniref:Pentatricopeptide repeat-containing protein n=1 Tax=Thalictrum thalictroides TaxID=46969 RepID=A0A7J6WCP7_THATH|nr:Pentatricopeptide repeat-containing protein [Thalictrum thalictroides]